MTVSMLVGQKDLMQILQKHCSAVGAGSAVNITQASSAPLAQGVSRAKPVARLFQMPKRTRDYSSSLAVRHPNSAVGHAVPVDEDGQVQSVKNSGAFRFWFDERRFKGPGSVCVVHDALFALGGVRTGGYPKAAPIPGPLGYQRPTDWDLLWTPVRLALRAAPTLKPGQLICAQPGLMSLSRKRKLPVTLFNALGDTAWTVIPHSFTLPDGLPALQQHMAARQAAGAADELWILKTAQHLGKGLKILPAKDLCAEAAKKHKAAEPGKPAKPYVLAQKYVSNPLLIHGKKFGVRVWVLVLGPHPLRAYVHCNGLVLFANNEYDDETWQGEGGSVALGHVTNYAQNVDGQVWDLHQLKDHLGADKFQQLWGRICNNSALMCSAALADMQADHAALKLPPESAFEVLGLDFLVDTDLHPWLLEVNGTPSLAVDHCVPEVEELIRREKAGMALDMFKLLGVTTRFKARYEAMRLASKQAAAKKQASVTKALKSVTVEDHDDDSDGDDVDTGDEGPHDGNASAQDRPATPIPSSTNRVGSAVLQNGSAANQAGPLVLPRRVREALAPKSDAAITARVSEELQNRGGWQPLMHLFPIQDDTVPAAQQPASTTLTSSTAESTGTVFQSAPHPGDANGVAAAQASATSTGDMEVDSHNHQDQDEGKQIDSETTAAVPTTTTTAAAAGAADAATKPHRIPWQKRDIELRRVLLASMTKQ